MEGKDKSTKKKMGDGMERREFLKRTGLVMIAAGSGLYGLGEETRAARIVPGKVPDSVRGKLPMKWADEAMLREAAELHPFDLQGRMKLAVNARTTCVDPDLGYISYSQIHFDTDPPHMVHTVGDFVDDMGRHTDSLWLNRSATGDYNNDEVVRRIAQNSMDVVEDGLPWNPPQMPFVWGAKKEWPKERWVHLPEATRVILGMVTYHRATGDQRALDVARSVVHRFYEIADKNDKYLWFPDYNYAQDGSKVLPLSVINGGKPDTKNPLDGAGGVGSGDQPAAMMGLFLIPVTRYYEDTGDPLAAEMVTKFSRLVIDLMPNFSKEIGQTHSALATASGIFRAGQLFGISEFKDWGEDVYQKFIALDYISDFGWTPDATSQPRVKGRLCCETCTTVDFLEMALQLARDRDEKYWDHAERIAMNHLLEGQMLRVDFLHKLPASIKKPLPDMDPKWFTTNHVASRALGGFGSFFGPNDWAQVGDTIWGVQCCFGSGPRGLYDAWYHAAREVGDTVTVNLQFSKRLPSAVITSYMPGKASIEVQLTQSKKLLIRKPGWAAGEECKIRVNGKERTAAMRGAYFDLGGLDSGSRVRIDYPDKTRQRTERIGEVEFRTIWRGSAVVEMEPAGEIYPLYQARNRQDGVVPLSFVNSNPIDPL
jgi:Beta-L-arabinofuranosidase, GH127